MAVGEPRATEVAVSAGGARRWALRLALSALVVAALVAVIPRGELVRALAAVPAGVWVAAPLAFLAVHLVGAAKWRLLVVAAGGDLGFRVAVRCHFAGLFANLFLPSVVGGDAVRAGLALRHGRSASGVVLASAVDRLLDLVALVALAAVALAALPTAVAPAQRRTVGWAVAGLAAAVALAALVARGLPLGRFSYRLRRHAAGARRAYRRLRSRPATLVAALGLGLLLQLALLGLAMALGGQVGLAAPLVVWLVVWPLAKLAALLPVTQGGIGVREAALVALFGPFGVSAATALAAGLVFEAMLVGGSLVAGGLAMALGGRGGAQR